MKSLFGLLKKKVASKNQVPEAIIHIKKVALTQINLYYKIKNPISYMHKYLDTIFRGKFLKWNNEGKGERILGLFVKSLVEGSFKFDLPNGSLVSLPIGYSLQLLFASHLLRFKWS